MLLLPKNKMIDECVLVYEVQYSVKKRNTNLCLFSRAQTRDKHECFFFIVFSITFFHRERANDDANFSVSGFSIPLEINKRIGQM